MDLELSSFLILLVLLLELFSDEVAFLGASADLGRAIGVDVNAGSSFIGPRQERRERNERAREAFVIALMEGIADMQLCMGDAQLMNCEPALLLLAIG